MTYEERRTTVEQGTATSEPVLEHHDHVDGHMADDRVVSSSHVSTVRPSGSTMAARLVAVVFGILQLIIGLRILFLLLNAREGNVIVSSILNLSQPLVAPFEGIFQTNALQAGGSVLDIAAVAALVGWTILELIILALIRVPRPGEDV